MKKLVLLSVFGLLGTFTLASNGIVKGDIAIKDIVENQLETVAGEPITAMVAEVDCGCKNSPEGTCTVTYIDSEGESHTYGPYEMSYSGCVALYNQVASEHGFNPM